MSPGVDQNELTNLHDDQLTTNGLMMVIPAILIIVVSWYSWTSTKRNNRPTNNKGDGLAVVILGVTALVLAGWLWILDLLLPGQQIFNLALALFLTLIILALILFLIRIYFRLKSQLSK